MPDIVQNAPLLVAGLISAVAAMVHVFMGGPEAARPLVEARDLPEAARDTLHYAWHVVTLALVAMTLGFLAPAFGVGSGAVLWSALAAAAAFWSVALAVLRRRPLLALPQWALFGPIAAFGFWGSL
ncbi:MAG: hypothetical protein AAGF90_02155 [Pseudomonadota bacterium]